jgi:predicted transcriptional regulator
MLHLISINANNVYHIEIQPLTVYIKPKYNKSSYPTNTKGENLMTPKQLTSIRVSAETRAQLAELAQEMDMPQAWVIALALEKLYQERKNKALAAWLVDILNKNGLEAAQDENFTFTVGPDGAMTITRKREGMISFALDESGQAVEVQPGEIDEMTVTRKAGQ